MPASSLLTLVLPASSDSGVVGDNITRIARPTLSGLAAPGATIVVQVDGVVVGTTVASGYGTWSFVPPENLASGTHTISASELDTNGSTVAVASLPLTIDEVALPPTLMLATNSGTSARQPTLTGNAEAGATVSIRIDGMLVGTTTATNTGTWSFTAPAALADGKHMISATETDVAGNNSLASTLALAIDASAATPTVTLAADSDSGVVGDNITNIAIPTLDGTAEPDETINIMIDGTPVGSTSASSTGVWSFLLPTALTDGPHTVSVSGIDASGNVPAATTIPLIIDTSTPAPTVELSTASSGGGIDDSITNTSTPLSLVLRKRGTP